MEENSRIFYRILWSSSSH